MGYTITVLFSVLFLLSCSSPGQKQGTGPNPHSPPRVLLLGLDGVGFETFRKLQEGGYFRSFHPVAPMVATFPSISDPNWALLMGAEVEESYNKEFFDMTKTTENGQGQVVGSLINHLSRTTNYERGFNFKPEGFFQHLAAVTWTETSALYWLDALERDFFKTRGKQVFYAFILNTDFTTHTNGEKAVMNYLVSVDQRLQKIARRYRQTHGRELEIILVSDHGNAFFKPKRILVEEELERRGWHFVSSLKNPRDVAWAPSEIISFGAFYCLPGSEEHLARDISAIEGVHVALMKTGEDDEVDVFARGGQDHGQIRVDPELRTAHYKMLSGSDPFEHLRKYFPQGKTEWNRYFAESLYDDYPFAVVRAWHSLFRISKQSASVLVSPKLGYVFGGRALEYITVITGLESSHGSFHRDETLGIFVSSRRELPPIFAEQLGEFVDLSEFDD